MQNALNDGFGLPCAAEPGKLRLFYRRPKKRELSGALEPDTQRILTMLLVQ